MRQAFLPLTKGVVVSMLRPINFLFIFLICLALVLFSLQNTEPAVIKIINGVDVQAPLCVELLIAMGLGSILAWMFNLWTRLIRVLESQKFNREIRQKSNRIQQLEKDLEQFKAEILENNPKLPPASEGITEGI